MAVSCVPRTHTSARTAIRSDTPLIRLHSQRSTELASKQTAYNHRTNYRITQQQRLITASSKRQPKDPKKYATMDELRTHLMQQQGTGGFSGFLSWVGSTAFGAPRCVPQEEHNPLLCRPSRLTCQADCTPFMNRHDRPVT